MFSLKIRHLGLSSCLDKTYGDVSWDIPQTKCLMQGITITIEATEKTFSDIAQNVSDQRLFTVFSYHNRLRTLSTFYILNHLNGIIFGF